MEDVDQESEQQCTQQNVTQCYNTYVTRLDHEKLCSHVRLVTDVCNSFEKASKFSRITSQQGSEGLDTHLELIFNILN